ncbi:MAG: aminotransferase [Rhodospirillales bacterium]|nr:aminotransferase [Rhodospirillales bacterium]
MDDGHVSQNLTDEILKLDEHLVHSFADLHGLKQDGARTVIAEADGAYVYDGDGNRMLDGIGGLWCVNVGHGRREIIDAIAEQLRKLDYYSTFYNLTHPSAARLSEKVTSLAPGDLNHVYFGNSGSVANDTAIRILHHYHMRKGQPSKRRILSRVGAYHGSTHLAIAMTTPAYRDGWYSAEDLVHHLSSPYPYRRPDGMTVEAFCDHLCQEMRDTIEAIGAENIAAFIAEPIMGAGGVIVPPDGYHKRTREICAEYDIKMIADEVVTAFGRLGHFFASRDVYGIQPDIISSAKGLTSGYQPLSGTFLSEEIFDVVSGEGGVFLHGMTYSGHPAACAAGLANIAIMENEDLCGHVREFGPKFETALHKLEDLDVVGEVRGSHFMQGVEFVRDKKTREPFPLEANIGGRIAGHAQQRGLIVRPLGHMAVLSPPLILGQSEIDFIEQTMRAAIRASMDEVAREGLM